MKTNIRDRNNNAGANIAELVTLASTSTAASTIIQQGVYVTQVEIVSGAIAVTNASIATGVKLFTFPKGVIRVLGGYIDLSYVADAAMTANPEVGLGHVVATGAQATLGAAGVTMESIYDGTAQGAFNGTTPVTSEKNFVSEVDVLDGSSTAISVFFNVAAAWGGAANVAYTGTVTLIWAIVN